MPVILSTQEAEIRRITVWSQPPANTSQDPLKKNPLQKRAWWSGVAWGVGPEFKPQHHTHTQKVIKISEEKEDPSETHVEKPQPLGNSSLDMTD
jgi:hypothetical protein